MPTIFEREININKSIDNPCVDGMCEISTEMYNELVTLLNNQDSQGATVATTSLNYTQSGEFFGVGVGLFISFFVIGKSIGLILKLLREG